MEQLPSGAWYKDWLVQYDGDENPVEEVVINNPRVRTCLYPEEFIEYTNGLENAVRDLVSEVRACGVTLPAIQKVARAMNVSNSINGGA